MSVPPPPPSDPYWQQPGASVPPPPPGMYPPGQPPTIYYNYAKPGRTSGLAIASMVLGIVWVYWIGSILAVIFGHIAISQTSRDETLRGRGMAVAGLVLGYVGLGTLLLVIIVAAASTS